MFDTPTHETGRLSARSKCTLALLGALCMIAGQLGCLNPGFVNMVGGSVFPTAPGDTNFVLVVVVNKSGVPITFVVTAEAPGAAGSTELETSGASDSLGVMFTCPVDRIGLGDLDDPQSTGYFLVFPDGRLGMPWGQFPLNYTCGDAVVFLATADANAPGGVSITTGVVDGSTQVGPFSGADTFETVEDVLRAAGLM